MKTLIIGAAGFVGPYLAEQLKNDFGGSVAVTKLPHEKFSLPGITAFDLDVTDKDAVYTLLERERPDNIVHLAAQSSVALAWKEPQLTVEVNIVGCVNVLEAVRKTGYSPRILLVGSGEEYGYTAAGQVPISEEACPVPGNIYAATKTCQNMIGKIFASAYQMDVIMVRAFNHIGPGQTERFVVSDFCKQVAEIEAGKKEPVIHVGNLSAKRDFTDVRDIVRAYSLLLRKGEPGETYNVGSGKAIAVQEILDKILELSISEIRVEQDVAKLRPVDVPVIEADIKKLEQVTGWSPEMPLEDTLQAVLSDWRRRV